jgi:hypothetical protein
MHDAMGHGLIPEGLPCSRNDASCRLLFVDCRLLASHFSFNKIPVGTTASLDGNQNPKSNRRAKFPRHFLGKDLNAMASAVVSVTPAPRVPRVPLVPLVSLANSRNERRKASVKVSEGPLS